MDPVKKYTMLECLLYFHLKQDFGGNLYLDHGLFFQQIGSLECFGEELRRFIMTFFCKNFN